MVTYENLEFTEKKRSLSLTMYQNIPKKQKKMLYNSKIRRLMKHTTGLTVSIQRIFPSTHIITKIY